MTRAEKLAKLEEAKNPGTRMENFLKDICEYENVNQIEVVKGEDGYTPIKGVDYYTEEEITGIINYIQSQVKDGEQGPQGETGQKGEDGTQGRDGADGKSAYRGIDYWTKEDQATIISDVLKQIKVENGRDGKDADADEIVNRVSKDLSKKFNVKAILNDPQLRMLLHGGGSGGASIQLQTNNINNGLQTKLNLKQGANVTLSDDGVGGVTISSTTFGTGDVTGTGPSILNAVPRYSSTTGKELKPSTAIISDTSKFSGVANMDFTIGPTNPTALPTATDSGIAGNPNGTYYYTVTYYTAGGETPITTATPTPVTVVNKKVNLTSIPVSADATVIGRRIYRNKAIDGTSNNFPKQWLVADIADNTTTTYQDNAADVALTVAVPRISSIRDYIAADGVRVANYNSLTIAQGLNAMVAGTGYANTGLGGNTLTDNINGIRNTAGGVFAMYKNQNGDENTAFGVHALNDSVDSSGNSAFGYAAAIHWNGTGGKHVSVFGAYAGNAIVDAQGFSAFGYMSGSMNSTGYNNSFFGESSGRTVTTGAANSYFGYGAGEYGNGNYSAALGQQAGAVNSGSTSALGALAGSQSTGSNGLYLGFAAGLYETGSNKFYLDSFYRANSADMTANSMMVGTFAGSAAGQYLAINANTTISQPITTNTIIQNSGYISIPSTTTFSEGTILQAGSPVFNTYGTRNLFVGASSGNFSMSGTDNLALGNFALSSTTTGSYNTAIGSSPLRQNTTGSYNFALGSLALYNNVVGDGHIAIGESALFNFNTTGGNGNVAIGRQSQYFATTGTSNVGVGFQSLFFNTTGVTNMAVGTQALFNLNGGQNNTAVGHGAGYGTQGNNSIGIGTQSIQNTSNGGNIGVGVLAGFDWTTGYQNTGIGFNSGGGITTGYQNTIIGPASSFSSNTHNWIVLADGAGNKNLIIDENKHATFAGAVKTAVYTVATLPAAATVGEGAKAHVSDALAPTFGAAVVGGGAVSIPVFSTGATWNVG